MYQPLIQKHKKLLVLSIAILFIVLIVWGVVTYVSRLGKVSVTIATVPRDAQVTINGRDASSGTHWHIPGTYKITATKDGFVSRTKTVIVSRDKQQNAVALSLTPESDAAKKWAEINVSAYKSNEAYGAIEARANGEYLKKKHPITNVLPYTDPYYEISYEITPESALTVTIATPSPRYRYLAIEKLRGLGYNPTEFRVVFKDFKNPLGDARE